EYLVIVGDDLQQDFHGDVFNVFRLQAGAAEVGGRMDDVVNQAQEAVDEIVPRPRLLLEAAVQQVAVDRGKSHEETPGALAAMKLTPPRRFAQSFRQRRVCDRFYRSRRGRHSRRARWWRAFP